MQPPLPSSRGMYCLNCHYDLRGLAENRCPECGRSFDPRREATFTRSQHATPVRDLVSRMGKALEQALAPDDPDRILQRIRSGAASQSAEIDRLSRMNERMCAQLDFVLDLLARSGADTLAAMRAEMEQAAAHPVELVADEGASDEVGDDEPATQELLALQRAALDRARRED